MISQTRSNDGYAWTDAYNVNRGYTANGLNQYTLAGPASFTYDAGGNLTGDGTNNYVYDMENRTIPGKQFRGHNKQFRGHQTIPGTQY